MSTTLSAPLVAGDPVQGEDAAATDGMTSRGEQAITAFIVAMPFLALAFGIVWFWGEGVQLRDIVIAVVMYFVVGHGITIGYHRLLAHRSFRACRPLKLFLVGAGSMAFEGGPIGWVADHRRHHVFSDQSEDPHSPHRFGTGSGARLRGLWHAHIGWLLKHARTNWSRHAGDLLADRDLVVMNALFPMWCVLSLAIPFGLGWLLGGGLAGALTALLWAGGVRILVLHHVTWSINSLCHTFGDRPFKTTDRSTNLRGLALVSMGESWHNGHHAFPRSARHGLLAGEVDTSARLISLFQRLGWASEVHEPRPEAIARRMVTDSTVTAPRPRRA
jgi:stearoyl-CoA desaturase (Delta-9 desaturase)